MRFSFYKRAASLLICVVFLLSVTFVKPQKAEAVAVTTTTVVIAAVAAIMTACGVSYWANSQQDAINYLGGKIDDYLDSLSENTISYEEWLGISGVNALFTVIGNGVLSFGQSVANKILDFVRWFNQEESISSGGQPVGDFGSKALLYELTSSELYYQDSNVVKCLSSSPNAYRFTDISTNSLSGIRTTRIGANVDTQSPYVVYQTAYLGNSMQLIVTPAIRYIYFYTNAIPTVNTNASILYSSSVYSNDIININKNYSYIWIHPYWYSTSTYKTISMSLSGTNKTPDKAIVTPSASVVVPQALSVGQTLDISTNANVEQGYDVDDATTAILETVETAGGLISSNVVAGEAVPSDSIWLWNVITSLPATIANAIKAVLLEVFIPDQAFIDDFFANLNSIFNNRFSILSFPFALLGTFITKVASMTSSEPIISWPNIYEHFSGKLLIAAGSYNLNSILANQAIANMYAIYMILIKAIISFQFVSFLYAWFCDVFHMHNDDFANPFDIVEESDSEDGDGYDGSWSAW